MVAAEQANGFGRPNERTSKKFVRDLLQRTAATQYTAAPADTKALPRSLSSTKSLNYEQSGRLRHLSSDLWAHYTNAELSEIKQLLGELFNGEQGNIQKRVPEEPSNVAGDIRTFRNQKKPPAAWKGLFKRVLESF